MIRVLFVSILSLICVCASSQSQVDTTFLTAATAHSEKIYQQALRAQSRLNNGSKYRASEHSIEQHPYFLSEDWIMGSVFYDGERFKDVPLMYDLSIGRLIAEHYPSGNAIVLVYEKLKGFSVGGHQFEKIENDSVGNTLPKTDFYDILYAGESKVVAHRQKILRKEIESNAIKIEYNEKNRYFLFRNGVFFPVKSKRSALKLMDDQKAELRKFLKKNRIPFSTDRELMLKSLAEHYDSLR